MTEGRIIPAILTASIDELIGRASRVMGLVERIQIDIVGKAFSSEVSVHLEAIPAIDTQFLIDVQLMVREPITFLGRCGQVGIERVFGHVEYMHSQEEFIDYAFALGVEVGLALDLPTPVAHIERSLPQLDAVLLMAVPAGKSGQKFNARVLEKISQVRQLHPTIPIVVDGGIDPDTIGDCIEREATAFAVGHYLWESKDIGRALRKLQGALSA